MSTKTLEAAMKLWAIFNKSQKLGLMWKFLERHGELMCKNDFLGFLIGEYDREGERDGVKLDIVEREG